MVMQLFAILLVCSCCENLMGVKFLTPENNNKKNILKCCLLTCIGNMKYQKHIVKIHVRGFFLH